METDLPACGRRHFDNHKYFDFGLIYFMCIFQEADVEGQEKDNFDS